MDDINALQVGKNLLRLLSEQKKTQRQLAEFCGVAPSTASDWVTGKKVPRPAKMSKICEFLGCSLSELLQGRQDAHYLYEDAEELAQFLYDNPDYHTLFDAVRTVKKEDLEFVKDFIDRLKR